MEKENKGFSIAQIYTAVVSTICLGLLSINLNIVWEFKEWKGTKEEVDKTQNATIQSLTNYNEQNTSDKENIRARLIKLEAMKPDEDEKGRRFKSAF